VRSMPMIWLTVLAAAAVAQTQPNWTQQSPETSPTARSGYGMAYDSAHSLTVLFGGTDLNGTILNDTWVWDGSNWTRESPKTTLAARANPAVAFDSAHGQVVLFGGVGQVSGIELNDTWVWDGSNWTEQSPQTSPGARSASTMVYDSVHRQVVLFGGQGTDKNFNRLSDTWAWDGANWTQESPQTSPPARSDHAMAYDSVHEQVVMFGGLVSGTNYLSDTWVWDGSNWTQKFPQASPSVREGASMVFDSAHRQSVLFGGYDSGLNLNDTWVWDGSNWTEESPQTSPSARYRIAMAYDSVHDETVLFGGRDGTDSYLGDTWIWYGGTLPPAGPAISGVVSASAFGGFSSVAPGSWVEIYGTGLAPDTQGWTGSDFTGNNAPTSLNGVSVSIGGQAAFVDYISATQANAQLPSNISTGGALELTVTNANGASSAFNVTVNTTEPGLLAPPSFKIGANQYVVAQLSDGSYVLPTGSIAGVTSRPARPGETIVIYGVGFGSVTPNIPAGEIATETNQLSTSFEILFGKTPAKLPYFGLAPNFVGLYQFNVTVPSVANNDLVPLTFNLGGVAGTQMLFTAVHQ
jgi:uncharacterized protein (TIGR03437 family)